MDYPRHKIVVTERALDDWVAQLYGCDSFSVPLLKPNHMPGHVYEALKKYSYGREHKLKKDKRTKAEAENDPYLKYLHKCANKSTVKVND
jgi:hypothetical protein